MSPRKRPIAISLTGLVVVVLTYLLSQLGGVEPPALPGMLQ